MGRMGEVSVWIRNEDCTVAEDVTGTVWIRPCCTKTSKEKKLEAGHVQFEATAPGCYVVEGKTSRGPMSPVMAIVKCDETVCLNPVVRKG